jgi:hypothetical protein
MLGSSSYEFNTTMECRDRSDDDSILGGGGYNNINLLRNGRGELIIIMVTYYHGFKGFDHNFRVVSE